MTPITCNANYSINAQGEVYSHKRKKFLSPELCKNGYKRITLCDYDNGKFRTTRYLLHRLVAEHFVPNPDSLPNVNHIDNDRSNASATNLEWCTHSENMLHCHKQGRCSNIKASNAASERNTALMIDKFQHLLGINFIEYVPPNAKRSRGKVRFICHTCKKSYTARVDSSTFKTNCQCFSCARRRYSLD